jgi:hypothetical protein
MFSKAIKFLRSNTCNLQNYTTADSYDNELSGIKTCECVLMLCTGLCCVHIILARNVLFK